MLLEQHYEIEPEKGKLLESTPPSGPLYRRSCVKLLRLTRVVGAAVVPVVAAEAPTLSITRGKGGGCGGTATRRRSMPMTATKKRLLLRGRCACIRPRSRAWWRSVFTVRGPAVRKPTQRQSNCGSADGQPASPHEFTLPYPICSVHVATEPTRSGTSRPSRPSLPPSRMRGRTTGTGCDFA